MEFHREMKHVQTSNLQNGMHMTTTYAWLFANEHANQSAHIHFSEENKQEEKTLRISTSHVNITMWTHFLLLWKLWDLTAAFFVVPVVPWALSLFRLHHRWLSFLAVNVNVANNFNVFVASADSIFQACEGNCIARLIRQGALITWSKPTRLALGPPGPVRTSHWFK